MKEKAKKKVFNDEVFANLYYEILEDTNISKRSSNNHRVNFQRIKSINRKAFEKALEQYSSEVSKALLEKFKSKLQ